MTPSSDTETGFPAKSRVWELDFLRGIAIVMMMIMHFSYDVRYEFSIDIFSYLESAWFRELIHPVILVLFVGISGVCCSFSRNNAKRGLKLLAVSIGLTLSTWIITNYLGIYCLILFNVLHLLSISMLVYALFSFIEKKMSSKNSSENLSKNTSKNLSKNAFSFILGFIGLYIVILNNNLHLYDYATESPLLMPLGIAVKGIPYVIDFMPIIPWMGVFLIGSVFGRICYSEKKTLFPIDASNPFKKISKIFEFLGRHSLLIYVIHQPIFFGILYAFFSLFPLK